MGIEHSLGYLAALEERRSNAQLKVDVAELAIRLGTLTSDISTRVAPEIDRLKGVGQEHTDKLNEIVEELARLNRNLETLQGGLKRVINKIVEQERRLDEMGKSEAREKVAQQRQRSEAAAPPQQSTVDDNDGFDGLFKDVGDMFKDLGGLFRFTATKTTTKR